MREIKNKGLFKNVDYSVYYDETGKYILEIQEKETIKILPTAFLIFLLHQDSTQTIKKIKDWFKEKTGVDDVIIS